MEILSYCTNNLGVITDVIGLGTFLFSIASWFYSKRVDKRLKNQLAKQEEKVDIRLSDGHREIKVGNLRRKLLTRSEFNGLLGLLPMKPPKRSTVKEKQPRYIFTSIDWGKVGRQIEEAQDGKTNSFVVKCTAEELEQFKDDIIKKIK